MDCRTGICRPLAQIGRDQPLSPVRAAEPAPSIPITPSIAITTSIPITTSIAIAAAGGSGVARPAFLAVVVVLLAALPAWSQGDLKTIQAERSRAFSRLDADQNGQLSESEYLAELPEPDVRRRDFRLFDLSGDGTISKFEFAAMPGIGPAAGRGPMPDPFEGLLAQAIDAMDEAYEGWDRRPQEKMNSTFFAINFSASLATDGRRRLDRQIVAQADPNGDHVVSRDEAHRFLEIQLGIRWTNGQRLRLDNGRVVNFARFVRSDTNKDDRLNKQEFVAKWWRAETAEKDFAAQDVNGDGQISVAEFSRPDGPNIVDPVQTFRNADTNLDATLDRQELTAATPDYRAHLVRSTFTAFDDNDDDLLSLNEFRLSMLGNFNYPWNAVVADQTGDDRLTLDEFVFAKERPLFQLQARLYFHRLDRNRDQLLSPDEFEFKGKPVQSLLRLDLATGESQVLFQQREWPSCGSPSISPDGKTIAFDVAPAGGVSKSRIMLMSDDGENVRDLCTGLMPTWSKDGSQFACSRYEGGSGVWIMNADGTPENRISDGWGAQWSPDGKSIAFTESNRLCVYDLQSKEIRVVLDKDEHPYQYIYWNMCWSPDSKRMVFKGRLTNKQELAIINMTGDPDLRRRYASDRQLGGDLAWTPDGDQVVFNMYSPAEKKNVVYQIKADGEEQPRFLPGVPTDRAWTSANFSPDGEWLVLTSPN